ncbi:MAG: gluconate 2-dehydrogenase subunit 3 family protein [Candidatus Dormibacteria bacterium]
MAFESESGLLFFSSQEAALIDAIAARIIPGNDEDPGAREALVYRYIDRAVSGPYRPYQTFYRRGLAAFEAFCAASAGKSFSDLSDGARDRVLRAVESGEAAQFDTPSASEFFTALRGHVIEGMFGDPAYGGNANCAGWRLIGYPGTQYEYTAEEMQPGADLTRKPIMTLSDLQRTIRERGPRGFGGAEW